MSRPRLLPPALPLAGLACAALLATLLFGSVALPRADRTPLALPISEIGVEATSGSAVVVLVPGPATAAYGFSDGRGRSREIEGPRSLLHEAARVVASDPDRPFLIRGDARLPYRVVDEVLESLRRAGARRILLETRTPTPTEAAP